MEVTKTVTLSTAHISPRTREMVRRAISSDDLGLPVYAKGEYGWFLYLDKRTLKLNEICAYAPDLAQVIDWLWRLVPDAGILCFDSDGPEEEGLPKYDDCKHSDNQAPSSALPKQHDKDCANKSDSYTMALEEALSNNQNLEELQELYATLYKFNLEGWAPKYLEEYESYSPEQIGLSTLDPRAIVLALESLVDELVNDMGDIAPVKELLNEHCASFTLRAFLLGNYDFATMN